MLINKEINKRLKKIDLKSTKPPRAKLPNDATILGDLDDDFKKFWCILRDSGKELHEINVELNNMLPAEYDSNAKFDGTLPDESVIPKDKRQQYKKLLIQMKVEKIIYDHIHDLFYDSLELKFSESENEDKETNNLFQNILCGTDRFDITNDWKVYRKKTNTVIIMGTHDDINDIIQNMFITHH